MTVEESLLRGVISEPGVLITLYPRTVLIEKNKRKYVSKVYFLTYQGVGHCFIPLPEDYKNYAEWKLRSFIF